MPLAQRAQVKSSGLLKILVESLISIEPQLVRIIGGAVRVPLAQPMFHELLNQAPKLDQYSILIGCHIECVDGLDHVHSLPSRALERPEWAGEESNLPTAIPPYLAQ